MVKLLRAKISRGVLMLRRGGMRSRRLSLLVPRRFSPSNKEIAETILTRYRETFEILGRQ
ncbi:MAG TPA: hypothetical protein VLC46_27125 [Thermoanaerobaculia bacterium]|jgi:hypothetical protein|nr:hypothetical protein [Thermoanaerobaculia bacterium]